MHELTRERAQSIVQATASDLRLASVTRASGSFTNDVRFFDCRTAAGSEVRLVVKFLVDKPDYAGHCARAQFHALGLARAHGIPAPEPVFLDETGEVLGVPGIVTRFVGGRLLASPRDPVKWAEEQAQMLLRIHAVEPDDVSRAELFDGNHETLYFLRGDQPRINAEHPLLADIYQAVQDIQPAIVEVSSRLVHMDYWHGNVLWHEGRISAVVDWDFGAYGDPAIDVAYFRMNMHLRHLAVANLRCRAMGL